MTPPKGYKHTELGVLPEDWEVVRLGDVCEIKKGKVNPKKTETIPCVELEHISQDTGMLLGFIDSREQLSIKNSFSKGDVLFGKLRPYLRKFWRASFDGVCSSEIWVLQGKKVSNAFLFYLVQTARFSQIANATCGTKMPRADWKLMQDENFAIPPLAEQEKIAEILSAWDTQIQNFEVLITEKQALKKGLCQTLLTAKTRLKGFSEDWEVVRLGEVGEFLKGSGISKDDIVDEGIPCIRYGELYTTYGEKIEEVFSHTDKLQEELVISKTNDVVLPSSGETAIDLASASCILKDGVAIGGDTTIIRSSQNGVFLAYCLNTVCKKQIYSIAQGSSVIHLYANYLKTIKIPIPSLAEQEKIAEILGKGDKEIMLLEQKLESLKSQKRGLMQNLLNGKVRVKS